jgi:hypothetical protein
LRRHLRQPDSALPASTSSVTRRRPSHPGCR